MLYTTVEIDNLMVSITVSDSGGTKTTPHTEHPDTAQTHGRGLQLVHALALTVDIRGDEHGHAITAHLLRTTEAA